jgi:hypothetical protein
MPAVLLRLMSEFSRLPRVDARILLAYFGGCLVVYVAGRFVAATVFRLDGVSQSVFGMGGIFSNNVLLGIPIAKVTLGEASLSAVSLVLVFNSLVLWTVVTVSVEWARERSLSLRALLRTGRSVVTNPVVASILAGALFGVLALRMPVVIDQTLGMVSQSAVPLSLTALGMGLAEFGFRSEWRESAAITALKLVAQPAAVFALARVLSLPPLETAAVVMLAALPVGANVYLMSRQFGVLSSAVASSIVLTTALAAVTTPLTLTLIGAGG